MRHLGAFCRSVAWTRVAPVALTCAVSGLALACNFADFTKTSIKRDPACTQPLEVGTAGTPFAYWTFNYDPELSDTTSLPDTKGKRTLTPQSDGTSVPPTFSQSRLNGEGEAIALDGHQYAVYEGLSPDIDGLFTDEFTISAWFTLPAGGISGPELPVIWPILSTLGTPDNCGGYQLDVRVKDEATGPELVFSYLTKTQSGDAGGEPCTPHEVAYPVLNSARDWGIGRWHHAAASLEFAGTGESVPALYWEGKRLNASTGTITAGRMSYWDSRLYVGTNSAGTSASAPKFQGTIDEIAIFDRVLDDAAVADFAFANITRLGPSNCRWTVSEQWDAVKQSDTGSLSSWSPDSTSSTLRVDVQDSDWGSGVVSAHVSPSRDLSEYGTVHLQAESPNHYLFTPNGTPVSNGRHEFSIAHGLDYCTWILPTSEGNVYDIPLARPSYCASSTCQFPISSVDWIRLATDWEYIGSEPIQVAISGVDFEREGESIDLSTYGGAIGPNEWCWRPLAYELDAIAQFGKSQSGNSIVATLTGKANTTTRLAADFGSRYYDLSGCKRVKILGTLSDAPAPYSLVLQDTHGAWTDWDIIAESNQYEAGISENDTASDSSMDPKIHPSYKRFDTFDIRRVNQIAIQKPRGFAGTLRVEITALLFDPGGCERWGAP